LRYNTLVANERYVSAMSLASPGVNTFWRLLDLLPLPSETTARWKNICGSFKMSAAYLVYSPFRKFLLTFFSLSTALFYVYIYPAYNKDYYRHIIIIIIIIVVIVVVISVSILLKLTYFILLSSRQFNLHYRLFW
jgi:hypothetical protein